MVEGERTLEERVQLLEAAVKELSGIKENTDEFLAIFKSAKVAGGVFITTVKVIKGLFTIVGIGTAVYMAIQAWLHGSVK